MATKINIKHKESGMVKTGFYGFSKYGYCCSINTQYYSFI